jgi:hypothetical protein
MLSFMRIGWAACVALAVACAGAGCRREERPAPPSAEAAVAQKQRDALRSLLQQAETGPLVPFERLLVVVHQALVQDLLASAMPYERVVGRYRIRVSAASVRFEDGFALVRLDGRASLAASPEAAAFADVRLFGGLDVLSLDPDSGLLRGQVKVIAVDAHRVAVLGVGAPKDAEALIESLGRERLDAFGALVSRLQIPVRLERAVTLPAVGPEGGVRIAAAQIPVEVAVSGVRAFRGRLWISVDADVGTPDPAPPPAGPSPSQRAAAAEDEPAGSDLPALRRRLDERIAREPHVAEILARGEQSDVVVGVHWALLRDLVPEVARRYLDQVALDLALEKPIDERRTVEVSTPVGRLTAGEWWLHLVLHRVRGTLRAGTPELRPAEGNRLSLLIPVTLEGAEGTATARFRWDARSVAGMVCRDFEVTRDVRGRVLADEYKVAGQVELVAGPQTLLVRPVFPRGRFRLHVEPSAESWDAVRRALEEQDDILKCGLAIEPGEILPKLKARVAEGFDVGLPRSLFRPVDVPAGVRQSVSVEEAQVDLAVRTEDLRVTEQAVWYAASVRSRLRASGAE